MAANVAAQQGRLRVRVFGWWREGREEYHPEPGLRAQARTRGRAFGRRRHRTRRRLHQAGRGCMRVDPDRQRVEHHAALRGVPGRDLAPARLASQAQEAADEVGIDHAVKRAVFLDRDGVINAAVVRDGKPYPPADVHALEILPGVAEALAELRGAGFTLVVVTNQPDVARGATPRATVDAIHERLRATLGLDAIYACFHDN